MTIRTIGVLSTLSLLAGCGEEQQQPVAINLQSALQSVEAPFEYRIIKSDEVEHFMRPQVALLVETTIEVAKQATADDLKQLWRHMEPKLGDRRVFIKLTTDVPGTSLWGRITRLNLTGKWEVEIDKFEGDIDTEPYYFVDKIDRTKPKQGAMILTLTVANQIVERLKQTGWTIKYRSEDLVKLEQPAAGMESFSVTLSPEGIDLFAWQKDDLAIFEAIELLTEEFGIGNEIKRKMQSVIGSPEYIRGTNDGSASWRWTIRDYDVSYDHKEPGIDYHSEPGYDELSIGYAN